MTVKQCASRRGGRDFTLIKFGFGRAGVQFDHKGLIGYRFRVWILFYNRRYYRMHRKMRAIRKNRIRGI